MWGSTGLTRFLWRITALLQLVLPSFVSVAHAQLEREGLTARAFSHVESNTGKDCAPVHSPDCALCQHLTSAFAKPAKTPLPVASVGLDVPLLERCAEAVAGTEQPPRLPRAPPGS